VTVDLTTYSETDPVSSVSTTTDRVTATNMPRSSSTRVYYDYGTDYFGSDFVHEFETQFTGSATDTLFGFWSISDAAGDHMSFYNAYDGTGLYYYEPAGSPYIQLYDYETRAGDVSSAISLSTSYYHTVTRTNGTSIQDVIYTDSDRTSEHDTISTSCSSSLFDYHQCCYNMGAAPAYQCSGWAQNYDLDVVASTPLVKHAFDLWRLNCIEITRISYDRYDVGGILLWSKLGTQNEFANPEIGPDGIANSFWPNVAGYFGNGLRMAAAGTVDGTEVPHFGDHTEDSDFDAYTPGHAGTVEFWLYIPPQKPVVNTGIWGFDSKNETASGTVYHRHLFYITPLGKIMWLFRKYDEVAFVMWDMSLSSWPTGENIPSTGWHHFACTWECLDSHKAYVYIDGVQIDEGNIPYFNPIKRIEGSVSNASRLYVWPSTYVADAVEVPGWPDRYGDWLVNMGDWATYQGDWPDAVIDNIIYWNYAKTSFDSRYDETPSAVDSARLHTFDMWNIADELAKRTFDAWNLRNEATKHVFDMWDLEKAVEKLCYDAWDIAGELAKTQYDQYHIFSSANEQIKTIHDRFHLYGAARKAVVDLYNIMGPVIKATFDRWHVFEGKPVLKKVYDLYRIYQTAGYLIFSNAGNGGSIDYDSSIGFSTTTDWSTSGLSTSSYFRYGVRARNTLHTERNTDRLVAFETDGNGAEIEGRPNPVSNLSASQAPGGRTRLNWSYSIMGEEGTPTGFRIYMGTDPVNFMLEDTVNKSAGAMTHYEWTSAALPEIVRHWFSVKAVTSGNIEDKGSGSVTVIPDALAPNEISSFTVEVI